VLESRDLIALVVVVGVFIALVLKVLSSEQALTILSVILGYYFGYVRGYERGVQVGRGEAR